MYLPGWRYRRKVTISHENIDADLTHFPLLLKLGSSVGLTSANVTSIFDKVSTNSKKIALTKGDGISQIYGEIERWDAANKLSELWTSKNDLVIPSSQDTSLYFYYDNSHADNTAYIGDIAGSSPATNVWDSNHKLVSHMKDDPDASHIKDSTINHNDGTKVVANEPIEADGQIARAQSFDGVDDYIDCGNDASLDITDAITIEAWVKWAAPGLKEILIKGNNGNTGVGPYEFYKSSDKIAFKTKKGGTIANLVSATTISANTWAHIVATWDGTTKKIFINGVQDANTQLVSAPVDSSTGKLIVGAYATGDYPFKGLIDEVHISNIARSAAWIKANYHSMTDHLVTWGEEEECGVSPLKRNGLLLGVY